MNFLKKNGAGLLLCLAISIPAWFLGKSFPVIGGPVFAILIGMVLTPVSYTHLTLPTTPYV